VDVDVDLAYGTTLAAAVLLGTGFVLQQYAAEREPQSRFLRPGILTDLLRKPRWLLGIACMIGGYVLSAWSLGHLELTLVEPLLTTYLVFALVLAVPMSRQRVGWTEVTGALVLVAGVTLVSVSRSTTPVGGELAFGSPSNWWTAAVIAGLALVVVRAGSRSHGEVRATLTGLGAGLIFGIQDGLTRQTLEVLLGNSPSVLFTSWALYALVGAGILGLWLMQNAFSAGPLHASLPAIAAGEPVAGIALGILVFGDRINIDPGMLAIEATGLAALIVGVIAVARSSAFGGLRRITSVIRPAPDHAAGPAVPAGQDRTGPAAAAGARPPAAPPPPRTQPPRTQPPRTQPPRTQPPRTQPPRTQPPAALAPEPSPDGRAAPSPDAAAGTAVADAAAGPPSPDGRAARARRRAHRPAPGSEGG
jgi:drug/metabolite transporter (DMT)-like permease